MAFVPTDLATVIAWYKADQITASDADPLATWEDQSGNSHDLTAAGTARPVYRTLQVNSLPAVDFDGTDDLMSSGSYTQSGDICAVIVSRFDSLKNYQSPLSIDGNAAPVYQPDFLSVHGYSSGRFLVGNDGGTNSYQQRQPMVDASTWMILTAEKSATRTIMRRDGEEPNQGDIAQVGYMTTQSGTAYIHLGYNGLGGGYLNGQIAEIVVFTDSGNNDEAWVEGYLADKYAISLGAGHVFRDAAPESAPPNYNSAGGLLRVGMSGGMNG